ncbi:hypothetical protein P152DRAFT_213825 [Eremomyces bilateralis CBS 781.70]|uniref:Uncharacterized protein n=1 Tax=Eremomyces bilateralis CBS 781.70 TaxID=1392243 RepID=A0A6G1FS76_9PEZI|nr:uncharacterized protein P152DRAFT_213825 [Eremomyces bilateralis CBS 781.70]KAF1808586.1 hypothetical protein P152DRAFT_213825 [Eremomyces bilateralis CBS 781.70]
MISTSPFPHQYQNRTFEFSQPQHHHPSVTCWRPRSGSCSASPNHRDPPSHGILSPLLPDPIIGARNPLLRAGTGTTSRGGSNFQGVHEILACRVRDEQGSRSLRSVSKHIRIGAENKGVVVNNAETLGRCCLTRLLLSLDVYQNSGGICVAFLTPWHDVSMV